MQLIRFKLKSYGISDIGLIRQNNEDVWSSIPECNFFALADGMGGHKAGEVAAKEAISKLCESFSQKFSLSTGKSATSHISNLLNQAIKEANAWVYNMASQNESFQGMGTTLCCFLLYEQTLIYAHVGDSRIYRFRDGVLKQLTVDHSLRSELIATGQLDEGTASLFPYKNIITRAIGTSPQVEPDIDACSVEPEDIYFLCSDGLTDYVTINEMHVILSQAKTIKEASEAFVNVAKEKGGNDNITVVMIKVFNE
ncbi:MAG TPA: Stp1/IreP family PP2C-type Ser/Thr phosphatase [Rhabdochlamydiaceae bacterium]|nr:Stp1/IreP family PP2C-type Ser/Thr phosphatase [Rhabdochlamydiaceae bacterium]